VAPFEIPVGVDGLAVVVSTKNTFVDQLSVQELNLIWTANSSKQVNYWNELRADWPSERIRLYGPGTDSGTFDYFVEVVITRFDGAGTKGRSDYTPSEDDNVLVQGVAASQYALGYFGLAYVAENQDKIKAVPIDNGKGEGPVAPTPANVESEKYSPLSRPLFMYTDSRPMGELLKYFEWGLGSEGQALVSEVGYIPLNEAKRADALAKVRGA
jgi:phosphate transport system substrate-binding protein